MKSFKELSKNLKKDFSDFQKIKIAILGDSSTQFLNQAIKGYGYDQNFDFEILESDIDQIEQQIFNPSSELYQFNPEYVIIYQCSQKLLSKFYKSSPEEQNSFSTDHLESINNFYSTLKKYLNSKIIYFNFTEINDSVYGNYANKLSTSFIYQLRKINLELMNFAQIQKDFFINDISLIQNYYGNNTFLDPKFYINATLTASLDVLPFIAKNITDIINSVLGKIKKCIIFDLDNTLWGGVIGDDGIEKIELGELGIGKTYSEIQLWAKQLKSRGILIAICSKNNEETAKEPFEKHPEMILRLNDIAIFVANWNNKADNIKYIQKTLNIGFDSMIFVDDNPYERNLVRENVPDIFVPELPEDPVEYLNHLRNLNLFETSSFSENDKFRTKQYQAETKRTKTKENYTDPNDYLKSLKMTSQIIPFDKFSIPRVAQLTQRSNQFNLRTIRYTEESISKIANSKDYVGFSVSLNDKYGDYGIVGVIILQKDENKLFIDTWIMSCRVLKRGVEFFIINHLVSFAKENKYKQIIGEYIPTAKNSIVKDHYKNLNFESDKNLWCLNVPNYQNLENNIKKE